MRRRVPSCRPHPDRLEIEIGFTYPRLATKQRGHVLKGWSLGQKVHVRGTVTVTRGIGMVVAAVMVVLTPGNLASAAPSAIPGVTATTIRVGVPYIDVGAAVLRSEGVHIDYGSVPDAFDAVIDNINAHGGINGRKIVPYIVAVNPVGTAPAATACTQLTEDDTVFAVLAPLEPTCYLEHNTPVVGSIYPADHSPTTAQDFSPTPPVAAFDPLELSAMAKQGVFRHKKVAIFGGGTGDESELAFVQSALTKLHVPVVTTAVDSAPESDEAAIDAQMGPIAERFQVRGCHRGGRCRNRRGRVARRPLQHSEHLQPAMGGDR